MQWWITNAIFSLKLKTKYGRSHSHGVLWLRPWSFEGADEKCKGMMRRVMWRNINHAHAEWSIKASLVGNLVILSQFAGRNAICQWRRSGHKYLIFQCIAGEWIKFRRIPLIALNASSNKLWQRALAKSHLNWIIALFLISKFHIINHKFVSTDVHSYTDCLQFNLLELYGGEQNWLLYLSRRGSITCIST